MTTTGLKRFKMGKVLGSGTFAQVVKVTDTTNGMQYAMKILDKKKCIGEETHIVSEIAVLTQAQHPNIIRLYDVFETENRIYLQMELVSGGELFDRIVSRGYYTEGDARKIVLDILNGINYLHNLGYVHRDLKPENLLMSDNSEQATVKLADFGLSAIQKKNVLLSTTCGTLTYMAPEVLDVKHSKHGYLGKPADMWSIGVITYILLSGYPPFVGANDQEVIKATMSATFQFHSPDWDDSSAGARDFIQNLLQKDPAMRLTAQQALRHQWLTSNVENKNLYGKVTDNLRKNFNARTKLKGAIEAVTFMTKLGMSMSHDVGASNMMLSPTTDDKVAVSDLKSQGLTK